MQQSNLKLLQGSTHVVEQILVSIVPSILTFDFDLILGLFFTFWGPNGIFLGSKTILGSAHVVQQFLFSIAKLSPNQSPSWAVAGFNSSFSVRQAGRQADPIQNSTFWSESDFTVKSKVVSLDG